MLRPRHTLPFTLLLALVLVASQLLLSAHSSQHDDGMAAHIDCTWCTADIASDLPPANNQPLARPAPAAAPLLAATTQATGPTPRYKAIRAPPVLA